MGVDPSHVSHEIHRLKNPAEPGGYFNKGGTFFLPKFATLSGSPHGAVPGPPSAPPACVALAGRLMVEVKPKFYGIRNHQALDLAPQATEAERHDGLLQFRGRADEALRAP